MQGMEEILTNEGYGVTLVTITDDQIARGAKSLRVFQEQRGDAVVLAGPDIPPNFIIEAATLTDQTLLVDNTLQETSLPAVIADNQGGSIAVTNHLIKVHEHEQIVMLRGPQGWISSEERTRGYLAAMNAAGLQPFAVYAEDTTVETGQETLKKALEEKPNTTAIVAANDAMAIGALRTARKLGYSTPTELAIVGFDNISWASYADSPLTTVRIPKLDMGRIAARSLLDQLNGSISSPSRIIVATELVIRESCGCKAEL
jgi:DNA-binding LacI/PurR family transcriptional regulator